MGHLEKFSLFKFVVRNPSASSKILATLVPVFFNYYYLFGISRP